MCGIVGYVGPQEATPIIYDGLRKLEYRGYDSAGMVAHADGRLAIVRSVGKLDNLGKALLAQPLPGNIGLGHTRWATHGRPSEQNAHPHASSSVAVVHNGIIENHLVLKAELEAEGVVFASETDTEIVAHLIERELPRSNGYLAAIRAALLRVEGAYALGILFAGDQERLYVAKNASPLVIGIGDGETLCGSDIPALLARTRDMLFLEDGDLAVLSASGAHVERLEGGVVLRPVKRVDWNPVQAEKGGFKHFMLKEIFEQPRAIEDTLRGRIRLETGDLEATEVGLPVEVVPTINRVYLVACGTSFHACIAGRYWIERLARLPVVAELGSEVRYRDPVFQPGDLVVAVSQSGETADTLAAVRAAKEAGARILAVANVVDSAIPRVSDGAFYTHAGPEIGVASTKCFTAQLMALFLLAVHLGRGRGALSAAAARQLLQAASETPGAMRECLEHASESLEVARTWHHTKHMLFIGRGLGFPIALEGALKLKEISYAHAEGYAAGELKHGPIALIDGDMPVVVVLPQDRQYDKTLSNLQEVRARDGRIIGVLTRGDTRASSLCDARLFIPDFPHEELLPLLTVIPLQLLAYYMADLKGTDVDQPRNLAKTVTVE